LENHPLIVVDHYPDTGMSTYLCETCGRFLLMSMLPYKKMVMVEGDEMVTHSMFADVILSPSVEDNLNVFRSFLKGLGVIL
jgi:hypothetical protein